MYNRRKIFAGVAGFLVLLYPLVAYILSNSFVDSRGSIGLASSVHSFVGSRPVVHVQQGVDIYTARILDSKINGTVRIGNQSRVLMKNITFVDSSYLVLEESAEVFLSNFTVSDPLYIYVLNASTLHLGADFNRLANVYIWAYGESNLYLEGTYGGIYFYCHENASIKVVGNFVGDYVFLYDSSKLMLTNSYLNNTRVYAYDLSYVALNDVDDGATYFYLSANSWSRVEIAYSNLPQSTVTIYDYSSATIVGSKIHFMNIFDNAKGTLIGCVVDGIYVRGNGYIGLDNSTATTLSVSFDGDKYDAWALVTNSHIQMINLQSLNVSHIIDSNVTNLYYYEIYNDTVMVNATHAIGSSHYPNYINVSSYADYTYRMLDYYFVRGAPYVFFNRTSSSVYLVDVASAEIHNVWNVYAVFSNISLSLKSSYAYLYTSSCNNVTISNTNLTMANFYFLSSEINIRSTNITSQLSLNIHDSVMAIVNSMLNSPSISIYSTTVFIDTTLLNDTENINLNDGSYLYAKQSTINTTNSWTTLSIYDSKFIIDNSTIALMASANFLLNGSGTYIMNSGVVINRTDIIYGISTVNNSDVSALQVIHSIDVYASNLTIKNYSTVEYGMTSVNLYFNSNLTITDITASDFDVSASGSSVLTLRDIAYSSVRIYGSNITIFATNATISEIDCDNLRGEIYGSSVDVISTDNVYLYVNDSTINSIDAYDNGSIRMEYSQISELSIGNLESLVFLGLLPYGQVTVNHSVVGSISLLGSGNIHVDNSNVSSIIYLLASVLLERSVVNFTLRNYLITTGGSITIDSNSIPSGIYTDLLVPDGSTTIVSLAEGLVSNRTDLNLTVRNSEFMGLGLIGGSVYLFDSNISVAILVDLDSIRLANVLFNATALNGPPEVFLAGSIDAENLTMVDADLFVGIASDAFFRNVYTNRGLFVINSTVTFEDVRTLGYYNSLYNSNLTMRDVFMNGTISIHSVNGLIRNLDGGTVRVENSLLVFKTANFDRGYFESSAIYIDNGTLSYLQVNEDLYLNITNSAVGSIVPYQAYVSTYTYSYDWRPENVSIVARNSVINTTYIHYRMIDGYGVLSPASASASFVLLTSYNATTTVVRNANIDVYGFSIINITNFWSPYLNYVEVIGAIDSEAPTIVFENTSLSAYEFGLNASVYFEIIDRTPEEVWLLLNSTEITRMAYSSGEPVLFRISDYISGAGHYVVKIYANDRFGNENSLRFYVDVYPAEPPTIVSSPPRIINITLGEQVNLSWIARDKSPSHYVIHVNGTLNDSGVWEGDDTVLFSFKPKETGVYNVTITFSDKLGLESRDSVIIKVKEKESRSQIPIALILAIIVVIVLIVIAILLKRRKTG